MPPTETKLAFGNNTMSTTNEVNLAQVPEEVKVHKPAQEVVAASSGAMPESLRDESSEGSSASRKKNQKQPFAAQ